MLMLTQKELDEVRNQARAEARNEIAEHLKYQGEYVVADWHGRDLLHNIAIDIKAGRFTGPVPPAPF